MRFLVAWLVVCVLPFVAVASTAPWRTVAASSSASQTGSYKNCIERPGQGPNDNEVLYFTKPSGDTVHFVCQKDLCGNDISVAILGRACIRNGNKCYENAVFKCSISAIDDTWSVDRYNNRYIKLSPCSKAGGNWFLDNVPNSSQVIVDLPNLSDEEIYTEGYAISGGSLSRACTAYVCDSGFVYDKKKKVCEKIICDNGETRNVSCTGIDNADKCTEKCVGGVRWEFVSLDLCADGYRVEQGKCILDIKAGDKCKSSDLPQFAKAGKYIKSGGVLKCAATECDNGKYLVVNSSGASQGWCVAATYCQATKKMGDECRLKIIDNVKTDLSCDCTVLETEEPIIEETDETEEVVEQETESETDEGELVPTSVEISEQDEEMQPGDTVVESDLTEVENTDETDGITETEELEEVSDDIDADSGQQAAQDLEAAKAQSQAKIDELRDNAQAMKEKEQSLANRTLGAAAIGATGIGGMMAMSALSEQQSDADAERDMAAYLQTFRCDFGTGKRIDGGAQNVELPGANELMPLYSEYIALANNLKLRKQALGLRAGIESETILDQATTGLYDDIGTGKTSGMYVSLAAALSGDADALAAWDAQKAKTAENLKTGLTTAGIGAAVGLVGNAIINSKSAKNKADEILARYEMQRVQDVHENIVLKNTVTEPIVIDDSTDEKTQDLISSIVPTLETEDAPESDDKTGASGMKDTKIAEIKDVLTQLSDGSDKDYIIIAEDELFDGTRLKDTGKKKLDDIWAGMTGRACMFQFDIYEPIGNLTQTNFNKSYARRKALEEYVVSKQYSPSIQVDFVSADVSSGRCSNEEPPCPYLWVKLKCIQDKDILVADAGQTAWLPLNIKHPIDDAGLDGTIYQSATRGEYSDYLGRAERVCVKAGGKWKDDIKIYTVLENTQGTYNTYFDATCDFGKPDRTSGSKRCANMCRQADVECTQSGNMGYDNYTSCFIYPPQD